jgi:uncharacterized protein YndB with AHSA1/START domain
MKNPNEKDLTAKAETEILADVSKVWDALINPAQIKQYLYGFDAISDWKIGSPIIFRGEYEGKTFEDKAVIRFLQPNRKFGYAYWSPFFETEDTPENYVDFTFYLEPQGKATLLKVTRGQIKSHEQHEKECEGLRIFLQNIKKLFE